MRRIKFVGFAIALLASATIAEAQGRPHVAGIDAAARIEARAEARAIRAQHRRHGLRRAERAERRRAHRLARRAHLAHRRALRLGKFRAGPRWEPRPE